MKPAGKFLIALCVFTIVSALPKFVFWMYGYAASEELAVIGFIIGIFAAVIVICEGK